MQFNSAIALAILTFTTSAVAQGYYEEDYSLYAREVDDADYDVLAIRDEAYLEGYMHGLVARQNKKAAAKPVSQTQRNSNKLAGDSQKVGADQKALNRDRNAYGAAQRKQNSDVASATKDGRITKAEEKTLAGDSAALGRDRKAIGADRAALKGDKAAVRQDLSKFGRRSWAFDDEEFDFEY